MAAEARDVALSEIAARAAPGRKSRGDERAFNDDATDRVRQMSWRRSRMSKVKHIGILAVLSTLLAGSVVAAPVVLRASHQFPGGKGDVRDEMVQIIARDAKAAGVDLDIQVYPGASLFKPNEQWNALVNGQLDISSFPLDYASGKVRAFGATLMPGLVRSHERAARLNNSR